MRKTNFIIIVVLILILTNPQIYSKDHYQQGTYKEYLKTEYKNIKWNFYIMLGYQNFEKSNYYKAISNFKKAIDKGCKSPNIRLELFQLYIIVNQFSKSYDLISTFKDEKISFVYDLYKYLGYIYFESKLYDDYLKCYKNIKLEDEANNNIGEVYYNEKKYDLALKYFKEIKSSETRKNVFKSKGEDFLKQKNYDKAIECFKTIEDNEKVNEIVKIKKIEYQKKIKPIEVTFYNTLYSEIYIELTFSEKSHYGKFVRTYKNRVPAADLYGYSERNLKFDWNTDYGYKIYGKIDILCYGIWDNIYIEFDVNENIHNNYLIFYTWSDIYGKYIIRYGRR